MFKENAYRYFGTEKGKEEKKKNLRSSEDSYGRPSPSQATLRQPSDTAKQRKGRKKKKKLAIQWRIVRSKACPCTEKEREQSCSSNTREREKDPRLAIVHSLARLRPSDSKHGKKLLGFMKAVMRKWPSAIEKPDNSGWTPLHIAAFMGNEKFVKLLLEVALEMDPPKSNIAYSKDNEGSSALHIAAREGNVKVMKELINKCPDICEMLNNMGWNALHVAAESGKSAAITFFLERPECKGLINEQDTEGNTPMHLAAYEGHFQIASQLGRENDVDLYSTNNDGLTTMDNALLKEKLCFRLKVHPFNLALLNHILLHNL
nr:protein accelerated cell death 6 [Quercus suber]